MKSAAISSGLLVAGVALVAGLSTGVGRAAAPQAAPVQADTAKVEKETFDMVCGACHEATLVEGPHRLPGDWDDVISRMQSYGASATEQQFRETRSYLLRTHGKVNVNTATAVDIAPVLDISAEQATALVAHRESNGKLASLDDLKKVPGIAAEKIDARKDRVAF